MAFEEKIKSLNISDNAKNFIRAIVNPNESIFTNVFCQSLYQSLINQIKKDGGLLSFLMKTLDEDEEKYIKLPHYVNINPRKLKSTEFLLKENGKYGILLNIISNRKTFNFSIRLRDMTIIVYNEKIQKQTRGSYRSFTLTDKFGNISENWKTLKVYSIDEEKKIFDNHDKSDIVIKEFFISDELSKMLKDIRYYLLKLYIKRLELERDYWENMQKKAFDRMETLDIKYEMKQVTGDQK